MKSKHALNAYCTKCKVTIEYSSKKQSRAISNHMTACHQDLIDEYFKKQKEKKRKTDGKLTAYFAKKVKTHDKASTADQIYFWRLLAQWTAHSLRPFSITEDESLQEVINFATSEKGSSTLSLRNTNQKYAIEESDVVAAKVAQIIKKECSFYSCTTDMWSSRHHSLL